MQPKLQKQLAFHRHGVWLFKIPFFNCKSETERSAFITAIAMQLRRVCFGPDEDIMVQGCTASYLYIIQVPC